MLNTIIRKTSASRKPKNNTVNWKSDDNPGLRNNWSRIIPGAILLLAGYGWKTLQDNHTALGEWTFSGTALLVILVAMLGFVLAAPKIIESKIWLYIIGIVYGMVLIGVIIYLASTSTVNIWVAAISSIIVVAIIAALLFLNTLTTWYPHLQDTPNRDRS